jgi:hypothetical protein
MNKIEYIDENENQDQNQNENENENQIPEHPIIIAYIKMPFQMIDGEMKIYNDHATYEFSHDHSIANHESMTDFNEKTYTIAHVKMPFQIINDEIKIRDEDVTYTFTYTDELPEINPAQNSDMMNKIIELLYGTRPEPGSGSESGTHDGIDEILTNDDPANETKESESESESESETTDVIPYDYKTREPKSKTKSKPQNTSFKNGGWKRNKTAKKYEYDIL